MMTTQSLANTVTPSQLGLALDTFIEANIPTFIWGSPGIGKSQIVKQTADRLNREVVDVRAVLLDPVDLRGLPHVNSDGKAHWAQPDFLPTEGTGVLFLDELNAAPPLVQAACYQLVLDRAIGEYRVPDGWAILAAGNLETDRAVTHRMPTALANRFGHFTLITDSKDWRKWAVQAGIRPEVIAFLSFKADLLHSFDPKSGEKAFPSPRSWEFVSAILEKNPDPSIEMQTYSGIVGQAAAVEFTGFLRVYRDLPSLDMILMNPDTAKVPTMPSAKYAVCTALARIADDNNLGRIKTYVDRLPSEFTVLAMQCASHRDPELQNTRAFIEFGAEYADVIY